MAETNLQLVENGGASISWLNSTITTVQKQNMAGLKPPYTFELH